jgi:hypothetical protein
MPFLSNIIIPFKKSNYQSFKVGALPPVALKRKAAK